MSVLRTGRIMFAICLLITCLALWAAHSFYFVLHYLQNYEKTVTFRTSYDRLNLPSAVFCNRFPFTQSGLDRLGSSFNQAHVIDYLQTWLNPSIAGDPQTLVQNTTFLQQAELTISQTLLGQTFKERMDSTLSNCIEMISGCSVQGSRMSGIECCNNYVKETYLATMNGLCWVFNMSALNQKAFGVYQGVRLDFRISRPNFDPVQHPGLDIYLLPAHYNSLKMATELNAATSTYLRSKVGTSLKLRKKTYSRLERSSDCGYTVSDANQADQDMEKKSPEWINCVVKATIKGCKCVPLNVVLWVYRGDFSGQIISELNATSICTVGEYDKCARSYMDFIQPQNSNVKISDGRKQLKSDIESCRSKFRPPCQTTEYSAKSIDYPLTSDLQASTDFVSSLSFGFESLEVEYKVRQQSMPLFELATYAGWNFALWFVIGFIIWIIFTTSCCRQHRPQTGQQPTKVAPSPPMVSGAGSPASRPDSGAALISRERILPPINSARSHDTNVMAQRLHLNSG